MFMLLILIITNLSSWIASDSFEAVFNISDCDTVNINVGQTVTGPSQVPRPSKQFPTKKVAKLLKCKRNPSIQEFRLVAENLGRFWKPLGEEMKFPWGKLDNIEEDNRRQVDRCHQLLRDWYDLKDDEATISALSEHLITIKAFSTLAVLAENVVTNDENSSS
ncbi:FAS-associated death domain protein-like isoform X2 [Oratosquilla oratoria]|uniref:FAS-associated death domain protein-like isoform X2 n=1 Tax=Oratosquilla oratoria TaxID=337810 RepID=UPI003F773A87